MVSVAENKNEYKTLIEAGIHRGHHTRFWHPKMKKFIYKNHANMHLIDVRETKKHLEIALDFIRKISLQGGRFLAVGTKLQSQGSVKEQAKRADFWYVTNRWIGGTLTNFVTIEARIKHLISLKDALSKNELTFYTKRDEVRLRNRVSKLERLFEGVQTMDRVPDVLFIVDVQREAIAIKEAKKIGIPVVAMVDSNCNPELVDYPIPANDDSEHSIDLIMCAVADAILEGKKEFDNAEILRQSNELKALSEAAKSKSTESDKKANEGING